MRTTAGILCFLAGAVIYLLFRPSTLLGFQLLDAIGIGVWVDEIRANMQPWTPSDFIVYCLPNGLWSLAYLLIVDGNIHFDSQRTRLSMLAVIPVIGMISELMQGIGWLSGTFDICDLFCYGLPLVIYCLI